MTHHGTGPGGALTWSPKEGRKPSSNGILGNVLRAQTRASCHRGSQPGVMCPSPPYSLCPYCFLPLFSHGCSLVPLLSTGNSHLVPAWRCWPLQLGRGICWLQVKLSSYCLTPPPRAPAREIMPFPLLSSPLHSQSGLVTHF